MSAWRLSRRAWRWLASTWAAVTMIAVGATAMPSPVEQTDPTIPVVVTELTSAAPPPTPATGLTAVPQATTSTTTPPPSTTTTAPAPATTTTPKPKPPATTPQVVAPAANSRGEQIVAFARTFFGIPYLWGGLSLAGLDCSGLVVLVLRHFGINPPRTSADQAAWTIRIPASAAVPGDLVFLGSPVHHVGIYIGNGQMIDAQQPGTVVGIHKVAAGSFYGRIPS